MRPLIITLLLLTFSTTLFADKFVVKSFKRIDNKILLNKDKRTDDNDELCGIVLVRTSLTGLGVSASTPVVGNVKRHEGDYWVYLSEGTQMIKFFKDGFESYEYKFPERIEKGRFYLLELEYQRTAAAGAVNTMGFVVINSQPEGAEVLLNGKETGEYTPFTRALNEGYYRFTLKKELYKNYPGDFTVKANQTSNLNFTLLPDYGSLRVASSPEQGAAIYIDDENTGKKTPAFLDKLKKGNHKLSLKKPLYATINQTITINTGQTTAVNAVLKPLFGSVNIRTDAGDEIYIDRQKVGTESYTGRLSTGQHLLEIKKAGHYPQSLTLNVASGVAITKTINLKIKKGTLQVQSSPLQANIFLNGKPYGQTPRFIPGLMVGNYTLRLQKQGYGPVQKQVTIAENKITKVNETLPTGKEVTLNSNPQGATLFVDGVNSGATPKTLTLSFGNHTLKLINGKKTVTQTIAVAQTGKTSWQVNLKSFSDYTEDCCGLNIKMVAVKGGAARIPKGVSDNHYEISSHKVFVNDFFIGKYEITQKQWITIMGNNPSYHKEDDLPVENISWNEIQKFIKKLNQKTGKHYRLPSEAEWEYAALGGVKSQDYQFSGSNIQTKVGWVTNNSKGETHKTGLLKPNELGIYDMTGNVCEWVMDKYRKNFYSDFQPDMRVVKGGSYQYNDKNFKIPDRLSKNQKIFDKFTGFRVLREK